MKNDNMALYFFLFFDKIVLLLETLFNFINFRIAPNILDNTFLNEPVIVISIANN